MYGLSKGMRDKDSTVNFCGGLRLAGAGVLCHFFSGKKKKLGPASAAAALLCTTGSDRSREPSKSQVAASLLHPFASQVTFKTSY